MPSDNLIEVDIDLGEALGALHRLRDQLDDLSPVMATLAETMLSGVEDNFASEKGPGGKPWEALQPETKQERAREGKWPGKILQRSGLLAAAVQPFSSAEEAGVSVSKRYAAIHQFGGTSSMPPGPAAVPPRPYLYISEETEDELADDIVAYLSDA